MLTLCIKCLDIAWICLHVVKYSSIWYNNVFVLNLWENFRKRFYSKNSSSKTDRNTYKRGESFMKKLNSNNSSYIIEQLKLSSLPEITKLGFRVVIFKLFCCWTHVCCYVNICNINAELRVGWQSKQAKFIIKLRILI